MSDSQSNVTVVIQSPGVALGVASTVCGVISIFFMAIIFGPLGLLFGVIGVAKKQYVFSIVGIIASIIGLVTSPIVWGIIGLSMVAAGLGIGGAMDAEPPAQTVPDRPAVIAPAPRSVVEPEVEPAVAAQEIDPETGFRILRPGERITAERSGTYRFILSEDVTEGREVRIYGPVGHCVILMPGSRLIVTDHPNAIWRSIRPRRPEDLEIVVMIEHANSGNCR